MLVSLPVQVRFNYGGCRWVLCIVPSICYGSEQLIFVQTKARLQWHKQTWVQCARWWGQQRLRSYWLIWPRTPAVQDVNTHNQLSSYLDQLERCRVLLVLNRSLAGWKLNVMDNNYATMAAHLQQQLSLGLYSKFGLLALTVGNCIQVTLNVAIYISESSQWWNTRVISFQRSSMSGLMQ